MVLTSGLVFALVLFKKGTLNFSEVDLATISVVSKKYSSCSLVNFSNTLYSHNHLFIIKARLNIINLIYTFSFSQVLVYSFSYSFSYSRGVDLISFSFS